MTHKDPGPVIARMGELREVKACRLCRSSLLHRFFTLGDQPLANDLVPVDQQQRVDYRAPLAVMRCETCQHIQLTHTVPPEQMFTEYRYHSGTSEGWQDHCASLADMVTKRRGVGFVVDIGSNDGTLLGKFKRLGWRVLGVDPARNLARAAPVKTERALWGLETAKSLRQDYGGADLITAQNVLGHVDDPVDFMQGIRAMLAAKGEVIIEVPDVRKLLEGQEFDTIYHEHISYWSIVSLSKLAGLVGLKIVDMKTMKLHGGSIRVHLREHARLSGSVGARLVGDFHYLNNPKVYERFQAQVDAKLWHLKELFEQAERPFWGYAASAKATVLLNTLASKGAPMPDWILDDTISKQGFLLPGVRIPIAKPMNLETCRSLVLLAWNWAEGLKLRASNRGFRGRYLVPLPEPRWEAA